MGVKRIYLDAASKDALTTWTSTSFGFSQIQKQTYEILAKQYTFVLNSNIPGRCIKMVPSNAMLVEQVSLTNLFFASVLPNRAIVQHCNSFYSLPPTTIPPAFPLDILSP